METRPSDRRAARQQTHRPAAAAACEACRRLKMRCIRPREQENEPCDRCRRNGRPCRIPPPRPLGRKPGSTGRYHGLEKAYRKMQAELDKARAGSSELSPGLEGDHPLHDPESVLGLLKGEEQNLEQSQDNNGIEHPVGERPDFGESHQGYFAPAGRRDNGGDPTLNREPISNPLALLADASEAAQAQNHRTEALTTSTPSTLGRTPGDVAPILENRRSLLPNIGDPSLGLHLSQETLETGLNALFALAPELSRYSNYFRTPENVALRDVGPDLDPVELGLVTMDEVYVLFPIYFARLHPINGILDPMLHTPEFVRSRSALLFTWILALTAQFDRGYASMAKRLRLHGEKLSRNVHKSGFKSVEIVQGYYISLLSATPAQSLAEERSWLYTMYAFGIAAELGLDQGARSRQSSLTNPTAGAGQPMTRQASQDPECESSNGTYSLRLARNKERTWLRILLWERANSAAYGRINSFPETELTSSIGSWYLHPLADPTDKHTCAFILLRRHLAILHTEIMEKAAGAHSDPHWVRKLIDTALDPWRKTWLTEPRSLLAPSEKLSAIFLYYVYLHNRLWTLSSALNIAISRNQELYAIQQDCFHAAVQICEIAVHDLQTIGEPLYCMLAPTWAMISYSAVLSLKIYPQLHTSQPTKETELLALLAQVAMQLERAGTTPPPRVGIAALLGQHLLLVLRAKARGLQGLTDHLGGRPNAAYDQAELGDLTLTAAAEVPAAGQMDLHAGSVTDPFLDTSMMSFEHEFPGDGFTDLFREIFGPSFGDVF